MRVPHLHPHWRPRLVHPGGRLYRGFSHCRAWKIIQLREKEIGYVSQFFSVIPRVSALDILTHTQTARGVEEPLARKRAAQYLERVGISPQLWNMYPATFSGGEKQRLTSPMP